MAATDPLVPGKMGRAGRIVDLIVHPASRKDAVVPTMAGGLYAAAWLPACAMERSRSGDYLEEEPGVTA